MPSSTINTRHYFRFVIPKALLLLICLSLSFVPNISFKALGVIAPKYEDRVQVLLPFICDQIQVECWRPFQPVLDHASYLSLMHGQDASTKGSVRKSDSLHTILKGLVLKAIPTAVTSTMVTEGLGFPFWAAFSLTTALLFMMGAVNFWLFLPLTETIRKCKTIRDDNLVNGPVDHNMEVTYIASCKTNAMLRSLWNVILSLGIIITFLFVKDTRNYANYIRLAHQIRSMDDTYEKIAKSFPEAIKIINEMKIGDGITQKFYEACLQITEVRPVSIRDVNGIGVSREERHRFFAKALTTVIRTNLFRTQYRRIGLFSEPFVDLEQGISNHLNQDPMLRTAPLYLSYATL